MMFVNYIEQFCRRGKNCVNASFVVVSREDIDSGGGSEMVFCIWLVLGMRCFFVFICRLFEDLSLRVIYRGCVFKGGCRKFVWFFYGEVFGIWVKSVDFWWQMDWVFVIFIGVESFLKFYLFSGWRFQLQYRCRFQVGLLV